MDLIHIVTIIIKQKTISMLKIARPVSFLLLSVALCSSGVIFAANETTTPKVGISQQQASLKGVVEDEFGPVAGASVVVKGTTNGTVTDMNGNFVLEVKKGDVIVISFTWLFDPRDQIQWRTNDQSQSERRHPKIG